jgi:hypothetical protein
VTCKRKKVLTFKLVEGNWKKKKILKKSKKKIWHMKNCVTGIEYGQHRVVNTIWPFHDHISKPCIMLNSCFFFLSFSFRKRFSMENTCVHFLLHYILWNFSMIPYTSTWELPIKFLNFCGMHVLILGMQQSILCPLLQGEHIWQK